MENMRRACGEERPPEVEEAGRAQAGANLGEEIPLQNMAPPQAAGDDRPEGAPEAAAHPQGLFEPRQPINPAEELIQIEPAGNRPFHHNVRRRDEARMLERRLQLDAAHPEEMTTFVAFLFLMLIVFLCIGHTTYVASYEFGWRGDRSQDVPIPVTDMVFNVTTPMTTTIFNVTSSDFN